MSDPDFDKVSSAPVAQPPRQPVADADGAGVQAAAAAQAPHLRDSVRILYKRRWLVLVTFLIVSIATAVETYSAVSVYGATAKLWIDVAEPKYTQFADGGDSSLTWSAEYLETQYDLLKSRSLARKTLDTLQLWDKMPPKNAPKSFSLVAVVLRPVGWVRGLFAGDSPAAASGMAPAASDESLKQSRAIDALLGMITVSPVRNSRMVNLTARSFDPALATAVVNAHATNYLAQDTEFKFKSSEEAATWLNARLVEQRKEVDAAEKALQRYRKTHASIPPEDSENITVQKLSQLNTAYTTARLARLEKEVVHNQLSEIATDEAALASFPAVLANATIQLQKAELATLKRNEEELLAQGFDINHPRVKTARASVELVEAKIRNEVQNVAKALRTGYEASVAQERNLETALQAQKGEALTMSQESIQFGILKREVDSTRLIFQSLLQSAKETGISTQMRTTNVRMVDQAEQPQSPISPNRPLNMTMGLFGGLLLGGLLAFALDYFDDRLKNPDEIKAYLGVPMLGLLPMVQTGEGSVYPLMNGVTWPQLSEAFRTLRANVIFSSAEQGCRSIVVTSTGPNEGKTMVVANFAISLAEAGLRVLVVDGDLRRPQQHTVFGVPQEPGVSNLVVGGVKPSEAIRNTAVPGLWVLPAGRIPPNPAELLGSARCLEFLRSFSEHFDWIVIDTPPVMAVSDASMLANTVTGVLFVVRTEAVSRLAAQAALEQLDNVRATIIGSVLNRVDLDRHSYYYSQYYRKEYAAYYAAAPKA